MSTLINQLTETAKQHKGTDLGGLLQWAALHIAEQDEALEQTREELATEENERIRLERVIFDARQQLAHLADNMHQTTGVQLAKDHAPHINIMAHHKIEPYATKSGKPKAAS